MTNPIDLPGQKTPLKPLNPLDDPRHADWFADVDNAKQAFEDFGAVLGDDYAFERAGAMAIAVGDRRFGKTSLLNRCAFWLINEIESRSKAAGNPKKAHVVDLRFVATIAPDNVSVAERMDTACHHLMKKLDADGRLAEKWKDEGQKKAAEVLPYLTRMLMRDVVVIVMLPPTPDLMDELIGYASLVPKRVVMLAETSFADRLEKITKTLDQAPTAPVLLRLSTLRPDDAAKFFKARRELHTSDQAIAEATPDDLGWFTNAKPTSVGELQQLLYELYDDVRRRQPPVTQLTRDMIAQFFISKTTFGGEQ